jgi:hypothetical protein
MSYRLKVLIGVVLVAFGAMHVAAAYKLNAAAAQPAQDEISLQRD